MTWAAWAVSAPLLGVVLTLVVPRRLLPPAALVAAAASTAAAVRLVLEVWGRGPFRVPLGGWGAPLGIDLYVDGLAAAMVLTTSIVGSLISVYVVSFAPDELWSARAGFWPIWMLAWASLHALFLSADLFNLYITLELLGIAATALVVFAGGLAALIAGTRYLLVAFAGSMLFLLGVALLYAETGSLDLYGGQPVTTGGTALVLMTVGMLLKTALFPLHFWLPAAHSIAPGPASAVLSGLVVKASFYVVVRLWEQGLAGSATMAGAWVLGLLGAVAIVWGALQALRQQRLKLLIAYSTVAQLGFLFLLFPLSRTSGAADAWQGALFHALAHAPGKAALFLAAATLLRSVGSDRIEDLRGAVSWLPLTVASFGAASISLVGLPPTGGFIAKWYLLAAAVQAGHWWWGVVVVGGGLLTALYLGRVVRVFFVASPAPGIASVPRGLDVPTLLLASLAVVLGLVAAGPLTLLQVGI